MIELLFIIIIFFLTLSFDEIEQLIRADGRRWPSS